MGFKFKCEKCGEEIVVKFLKKGEIAKCRFCGAESVVSEDAIKTEEEPSYKHVLERKDEPHRVPVVPFSSGHLRAQLTIVSLVIMVLLLIVATVSDYLQINLLSRAMNGEFITQAEVVANNSQQLLVSRIYLFVCALMGILFLTWIHRAHRNLPALGARNLRYSPGWAVGGFFVPILNLFYPFGVMREIWKASNSKFDVADSPSWENAPTSPLVGLWWAFYLISSFGGIYVFTSMSSIQRTTFFSRATILNELYNASWSMLIFHAIFIIPTLLAIFLIKGIDQMQKRKNSYMVGKAGIF